MSERVSLRKTRGKGPAAQEGIRISDWGLAALLDNARAGAGEFSGRMTEGATRIW